MQCRYCNAQVYVSHICVHCKEYYCLEHSEPTTHDCPSYKEQRQPATKQRLATTRLEELHESHTGKRSVLKKLFTGTFLLVILEETLRQISYIKNSPFFEPNVYVSMISQRITPYVASSIVFLTVCGILLTVNKFISKTQDQNDNSQTKLLKKAIPIGVYAIILTAYIPTTIQWLIILTT
jgi:hypothetical protein